MQLRAVLEHAVEKFSDVGIDSAQADAELLIGFVLGISRGEVMAAAISGREISDEQTKKITELFGRRMLREPLQHITGTAHFRKLELSVGRGVFVPRPETESVAQLAIDQALEITDPIVVDLGTGSGAIALSIADEVKNAKVHAIEKSAEAMPFAKTNFAKFKNATLVMGDLAEAFEELNGIVDIVISNPPYIPNSAVPRDAEVHLFDPAIALYGGEDGMDLIHRVSSTAKRLLKPNGMLIIEHADNQSEQVRQLLLAQEWQAVQAHQDLTGRDRAVSAIR